MPLPTSNMKTKWQHLILSTNDLITRQFNDNINALLVIHFEQKITVMMMVYEDTFAICLQ